jgi:hypothetical protein
MGVEKGITPPRFFGSSGTPNILQSFGKGNFFRVLAIYILYQRFISKCGDWRSKT